MDNAPPPPPEPQPTARSLALATLRRAASLRELDPSSSGSLPSSPSLSPNSHFLGPSPNGSRAASRSPSPSHRPAISVDSTLMTAPSGASLERTSSLLARSIALQKLTGSAPPAVPVDLLGSTFVASGPLPTLGALRERAAARKAEREAAGGHGEQGGLRRNNTVTGVGSERGWNAGARQAAVERPVATSNDDVPMGRAEARVNLMRKLSSRRLESPPPSDSIPNSLAVVGTRGKSRPRSGSLGDPPLDWRRGAGLAPFPFPFAPSFTPSPLFASQDAAAMQVSSPTSPVSLNAPSPAAGWSPDLHREDFIANGTTLTRDGESNARQSVASTFNHQSPLSQVGSGEFVPPDLTHLFAAGSSSRDSGSTGGADDTIPLVLRRGSIPPHVSTGRFPTSMSSLESASANNQSRSSFGIAAVEESDDLRARGSSASSSVVDRRALRSDSIATSDFVGVVSPKAEKLVQDEVEGEEKVQPEGWQGEGQQSQLAAKVERKRLSALTRSKEGAFPPPDEGYTFPSPPLSSRRNSQDEPAPSLWGHRSGSSHDLRTMGGSTAPLSSISRGTPTTPPPRPPRRPLSPSTPQTYLPLSLAPTVDLPAIPSPESVAHPAGPLPTLPLPLTPNGGLERSGSKQSARRAWFGTPPQATNIDAAMLESPHVPRTSTPLSIKSIESTGRSTYSSEMERDNSSEGPYSLPSDRIRLPADQLPQHKILAHLDSILGTQDLDSEEPSMLDHPPRRLLLETPVLQIVNISTVKDRHLFLFNDLLIIAKPIIEDHPLTGQPLPSTLANSFVVKSIVELKHVKLDVTEESAVEDSSTKKRHPLLVDFVDRFANDPARAISTLVQRGGLNNDVATIANLIYRNPDLNRNQVGAYLARGENRHILRAYIEKFKFAGVRIDDALRLFLLSIRLPHDRASVESVLENVALQWTNANAVVGFDPTLTLSLIRSIMRLSDELHDGIRTRLVSVDDFVADFRNYDPRMFVPESLLNLIYASVRKYRVEEASDNSMFSMTPDIDATISPPVSKAFLRLTYRTPSQPVTITIPAIDPNFEIKLHGTDLKFDPPILSFAKSASQSFRVTGSRLGVRTMVFIKLGPNAPRYQGIPINRTYSVERAFMQHTFQIAFVNHLDVKRKYMFSTLDASACNKWVQALRERINHSVNLPVPTSRSLLAAETVAVQVLRDALIAPEPTISFAPSMRPPNSAAPRLGTPTGGPLTGRGVLGGPLIRSNSFSKTYAAGVGKAEVDLGDRKGSLSASVMKLRRGSGEDTIPEGSKAGRDIVVVAEQNSLLPLVLSFLGAGASAAPHPLSAAGSAFQLPPL